MLAGLFSHATGTVQYKENIQGDSFLRREANAMQSNGQEKTTYPHSPPSSRPTGWKSVNRPIFSTAVFLRPILHRKTPFPMYMTKLMALFCLGVIKTQGMNMCKIEKTDGNNRDMK